VVDEVLWKVFVTSTFDGKSGKTEAAFYWQPHLGFFGVLTKKTQCLTRPKSQEFLFTSIFSFWYRSNKVPVVQSGCFLTRVGT
jgi:hypothetical protein